MSTINASTTNVGESATRGGVLAELERLSHQPPMPLAEKIEKIDAMNTLIRARRNEPFLPESLRGESEGAAP